MGNGVFSLFCVMEGIRVGGREGMTTAPTFFPLKVDRTRALVMFVAHAHTGGNVEGKGSRVETTREKKKGKKCSPIGAHDEAKGHGLGQWRRRHAPKGFWV